MYVCEVCAKGKTALFIPQFRAECEVCKHIRPCVDIEDESR